MFPLLVKSLCEASISVPHLSVDPGGIEGQPLKPVPCRRPEELCAVLVSGEGRAGYKDPRLVWLWLSPAFSVPG